MLNNDNDKDKRIDFSIWNYSVLVVLLIGVILVHKYTLPSEGILGTYNPENPFLVIRAVHTSVVSYPTNKEKLKREKIGLTDAKISEICNSQKAYYYFNSLDKRKQKLYAEIYYIMQKRAKKIYVSSTDIDEISDIRKKVLLDHPEIFYVSGWTSNTKYSLKGKIKAIEYSDDIILSNKQIHDLSVKAEDKVSSILKNMPNFDTDYEKVKYVYECVIGNTKYESDSKENQNILSVLLYKKSVCLGYAKTTQYILQRLGIEAITVTGKASSLSDKQKIIPHAWNMVKIDNNWYHMDTTWGDCENKIVANMGDLSLILYSYLCMDDKTIFKTHVRDNISDYPIADSLQDYFSRENKICSSVNLNNLYKEFADFRERKEESVQIKYSNDAIKQQLLDRLSKDCNIYRKNGEDNVKICYIDLKDNNCLVFTRAVKK